MKKFLPYLIVVLTLKIPCTFAQQAKQPIVTSDLLKMRMGTQIALSPDGNQAVYVVTSIIPDKEQDYQYLNHLWLATLEGDQPLTRQLTFGDRQDSQPVWSPDGTQLAFVRKEGDKPQIWILPLTGGEAFVLTHAKNGASQPRWSPDGNKILFTSGIPSHEIEGKPSWESERPGRSFGDEPNYKLKEDTTVQASPDGDLAAVRAWLAKNASKDNPRVINRLDFQGELDLDIMPRFTHLFIIDVQDTTQVAPITAGFQSYQSPDWSPDGQHIVCSSFKNTQEPDRELESEIWVMKRDGSEARPLLSMKDKRLFQPQFSPDGQTIAFVAADLDQITYAQFELGVVESSGNNARIITQDFDRSLGEVQWSPDSKTLYFSAASQGYFPLFSISAKGGKVNTVLEAPLGLNNYDVAGDRIVFAATTVEKPYELYATDRQGKSMVQITNLNSEWTAQKQIVEPQSFTINHDGREIQYWVMAPAGREQGKQYPVVLEMHGGPSAMWGPGEFSMWQEFQLLCSWGYGVVYANPRGSGGYGYEFRKANYQDWGKGPASDVLAALEDAMQQHDWMDEEQLFLTGGSYAGYLTAWIISQDQRFDAAVAQRGVYELAFFFGEGNAWRLAPDHFGGYPWEPEALASMQANSPQTFVANIETPLLIIHSDNDLRTGVRQSELLYKSLKVLDKPVEYVRYPGEGHELSRSGNPLRRMDRLNRIVEFFERYANHPMPPPATQNESKTKERTGK